MRSCSPASAAGRPLAERTLGDAGLLWPLYGTLIVIQVLVALLLLRRRPTGWVLAMFLVCIALGAYLVGWWIGTPEYIRMAIFSAMAIYMNQREVRAAFARDGLRDQRRGDGRHGGGAAVTIDAADLALLRRFEPIVKYTYGELFFPTGVEGYFAECDLFVGCQRARATPARAAGRADRRQARSAIPRHPARTCTCAWSRRR